MNISTICLYFLLAMQSSKRFSYLIKLDIFNGNSKNICRQTNIFGCIITSYLLLSYTLKDEKYVSLTRILLVFY